MQDRLQDRNDCHVLPGFGLPLSFIPTSRNPYGVQSRSLFPTALSDQDIQKGYINQPVVTIRELTIMRLINDLTEQPRWFKDIFDSNLVDRWKKEVQKTEVDVTEKMLDWVVSEMRFKSLVFEYSGAVNVFNGDVVKSDLAIPDSLQEQLKTALASLELVRQVKEHDEGIPHATGFSHRGVPYGEADLLDPSFFPLVYGRTRILRNEVIDCDNALLKLGEGEVIPIPADPGAAAPDVNWSRRAETYANPFSQTHQWLPSDIRFKPDQSCYIASYINNLHPIEQKPLYRLLEKILDKVIPLWDFALTPLVSFLYSGPRIEYRQASYCDNIGETEKYRPKPLQGESESDYSDRLHGWRMSVLRAVQPEPGEFAPSTVPQEIIEKLPPRERGKYRLAGKMQLRRNYREHGLQVIFRITSMNVNPENPVYETPWHTEGRLNEHICASAVFIYAQENISVPRLSFRQICDTESIRQVYHEPGDWAWLEQVFGLKNNRPAVQEIGSVPCLEGRVLIWPNIFQHRILPCHLIDSSRPGHIKVLNMLLVDPNLRIISTANVPPQQPHWGGDTTLLPSSEEHESVYEEGRKIATNQVFSLTMSEAKEFMHQAAEERLAFNRRQDVLFHSQHVSV